MQDANDGEERLVETFSFLLLLLELSPLFLALALVSFPRMVRLLSIRCCNFKRRWWCALRLLADSKRHKVHITLCAGVLTHTEVVVGLQRGFGVRIVQ